MRHSRTFLWLIGFTILASLFPVGTARAQTEEAMKAAIDGVIQSASAVPAVPTTDTVQAVKEVKLCFWHLCIPGVDTIAITIIKPVIEQMVNSTVKWINNGFDGSPAYVSDPGQYFTHLADGVAGTFISETNLTGNASSTVGLGALCSPFRAQIKLSLANTYSPPTQFQCSLTKIIGNVQNFYNDFSQGGWDAWFKMTQIPINNPTGAYLAASIELDHQLAQAIGLKKDDLLQGRGFLSFKKCDGVELPDLDAMTGKPTGKKTCIGTEKTVTPGSVIETQLEGVLGTGMRKLELADEFDEIISALASQLFRKTIFNSGGLAKANDLSDVPVLDLPPVPRGPSDRNNEIDIDGDDINDGIDTNGDGDPDTCFFGGTTTPFGPPCRGSTEIFTGGGGGGGGGVCSTEGMQYQGALRDAQNAVIAENPDVADLPNIESGGRQNARTFLNLVATKLQGQGYNASTDVLNGNGNPNTGDLIAVWQTGDTTMERYDAIIGGASTIRTAATAEFTGFIPLTCTPSGGNKSCGCDTGGGGGGGGGGGDDPGSGSTLAITSVSPTTVTAGQTTLTISGTELTTTVQFFDKGGDRNTVVGNVNAAKTQTTVLVPVLPAGDATVRIYKDSATFSNTKSLTIVGSGGGGGNVPTTDPTSSWSPTITNNGWWGKLSPDGRYVAYGNWGGSFVTDLESPTKQSWDFSNPPGLPAGGRCIAGKWMSATKLTFTCELTTSTMSRYEVTVGEWVAVKTADNPSNVAANEFAAGGDHWASYAVGGGVKRIVKDNQLLNGINAGGGLSLYGNQLAHICSDGFAICIWDGFSQTKAYSVATGVTGGPDLYNGYVAYASLGYVYGLSPTGTKTDLSVTGWKSETSPQIVPVSGARWVATFAGNETIGYYFLIRPWGDKRAITVKADGLLGSIVYKDGSFLISEFATNGLLKVITVPADAPRTSL